MYGTMVYWETAHTIADQPQFVLDWARQWQAAEKIVYSRTLAEPLAFSGPSVPAATHVSSTNRKAAEILGNLMM